MMNTRSGYVQVDSMIYGSYVALIKFDPQLFELWFRK